MSARVVATPSAPPEPSAPTPPAASGRCVLAVEGSASAAQRMRAATHCARRARQLHPLQGSACQPLGAWHCAMGFQDCLPTLLGGQACRQHFDRRLAQQGASTTRPAPTTLPPRDAAVAQRPDPGAPAHRMRALFSTCIDRRAAPPDDPRAELQPLAQTPSFVGNHSNGWDSMFAAMVAAVPSPSASAATRSSASEAASDSSLNLVLGFEHFAANYRIMGDLLQGFGLPIRLLADASAALTRADLGPTNADGTPLQALYAAPGAQQTLLVRPWQLEKTAAAVERCWGHGIPRLPIPMGLAWTDAWLHHLAQLSGNEVPALLQLQRYQLCEAMHRALPLICRQRFAVYGEPDFVMGISRFLIELGAGPTLILSQNGNKHWQAAMAGMLRECGYLHEVAIHGGHNTPDMARLIRHHRPDLLITPPTLDDDDRQPRQLPLPLRRVQLETPSGPGDRPGTLGYVGAHHLLNVIVDAVLNR